MSSATDSNDIKAWKEILGRWLPLAASIGNLVLQLHAGSPISAASQLIASLSDGEGGQSGLLASIKADTAALRKGPFRAAMEDLKGAQRVGPHDAYWPIYASRAEERLSQARALASGNEEAAVIEFYHAMVFLMMNHQANAIHHMRLSDQLATELLDSYARWTWDIRDARSSSRKSSAGDRSLRKVLKWPTAAKVAAAPAIMAYGLGWVTWYAGGYLVRRHGDVRVKNYIEPYNLIQYALSSVGGGQPKYVALKAKPGPREAAGWNYSLVIVATPPVDLNRLPG